MIGTRRDELDFLEQFQADLLADRTRSAQPVCYGIRDLYLEKTGQGYHSRIVYQEASDGIGEPQKLSLKEVFDCISRTDIQFLLDMNILDQDPETGLWVQDEPEFHHWLEEHTPIEVVYLKEHFRLHEELVFPTYAEADTYRIEHAGQFSDRAEIWPIPMQQSARFGHLLELLQALDFRHSQLVFKIPENRDTAWMTRAEIFNSICIYVYDQMKKATHDVKWKAINQGVQYVTDRGRWLDVSHTAMGRLYEKDHVVELVEAWRKANHPRFEPFTADHTGKIERSRSHV